LVISSLSAFTHYKATYEVHSNTTPS